MFNLRKSTIDVQKLSLRNNDVEPGSAERGKIDVSDQTGQISKEIKDRIRGSRLCNNIFKEFGVSMDQLDSLQITIEDLEGKYAECDEHILKLNKMMFEKGDFFKDYFYIILHEIVHWLTRQAEKTYFADPEEYYGFITAIAYEIEQGTDSDSIWNKIFPKISWHFHNEKDARDFFADLYQKALKMLNNDGQI